MTAPSAAWLQDVHVHRGLVTSAAHCKSLCKEPLQTGSAEPLLPGREIIFYPQQLEQLVLNVVNTISCAPVSVARLSHTASVDEIFFARLDANVLSVLPSHAIVANKHHWHMGVA